VFTDVTSYLCDHALYSRDRGKRVAGLRTSAGESVRVLRRAPLPSSPAGRSSARPRSGTPADRS
jgi:hypothetical protein